MMAQSMRFSGEKEPPSEGTSMVLTNPEAQVHSEDPAAAPHLSVLSVGDLAYGSVVISAQPEWH